MAEPQPFPAASRAFPEPVVSYSQEQRLTEVMFSTWEGFYREPVVWEPLTTNTYPLFSSMPAIQNPYAWDQSLADAGVFVPPDPMPEGWNPPFPQTSMEVFSGPQFLGPIDISATPMTTVAEDSYPWDAALHPPQMSSAGPQAQPLAPSLSGPPLLSLQPPIAHQDCPSSSPTGYAQQRDSLCTSERANSSEPTNYQLPKRRKRAMRSAIEKRHRIKEQEDHKKIETTCKKLQHLNAALVAEERALREEKLTLMGQLLTHVYCNDSNIAGYLSYAPKQM